MGNELLDESLCDIIAEKRREAKEIRDNLRGNYWDRQESIETAEDIEDEADRLDRARMKMEIEIANLRKENAKLCEALATIRKRLIAAYESEAAFMRYSPNKPLVDLIDSALADPPRNCDRLSAEECKRMFAAEMDVYLPPEATDNDRTIATIVANSVIDTLYAPVQEGGNDGSK